MAQKEKKFLITTESHEIFVIRQNGRQTFRGFCPACHSEVEMMSFDTAISHTGIGGRELMHRSEFGGVHSVEAATGHLLICSNSLNGEREKT